MNNQTHTYLKKLPETTQIPVFPIYISEKDLFPKRVVIFWLFGLGYLIVFVLKMFLCFLEWCISSVDLGV